MSMEIDDPSPSRHHKKSKKKKTESEKAERKRKRKQSETVDGAPTQKRHRSREGHDSSSGTRPAIPEFSTSPETSPFHEEQASLYLPIAPVSQDQPLEALCAEHLSPLILTYYPPFHGVIISYNNAHCCTTPVASSETDGTVPAYAKAVEYGASFVWLTANFVIFRPQIGDVMKGSINLQNQTHISVVCWNYFSATIQKSELPDDWSWYSKEMRKGKSERLKGVTKDDESTQETSTTAQEAMQDDTDDGTTGYFVDSNGKRIRGPLTFRVKHAETSRSVEQEHGFVSISGTLLGAGDS